MFVCLFDGTRLSQELVNRLELKNYLSDRIQHKALFFPNYIFDNRQLIKKNEIGVCIPKARSFVALLQRFLLQEQTS